MFSQCNIHYFVSPSGDNPVQKFLDSLSNKQQVKILRIFQYIKDYGLSVMIPHTKKITATPLWEIRILGNDNIRIMYVIHLKKSILLLHGFIKKSQKTPTQELHTALARLEQWKHMTLDK